jgi:hypothetical protein
MVSMFEIAEHFKQPLGSWDRLSGTVMADTFLESGCLNPEGEESCFYII